MQLLPRKVKQHTVDGRNLANQLWLVVYPTIYRVLYIPGGAGFLPSTVAMEDFHAGKYHQNCGCSMAMLAYRGVLFVRKKELSMFTVFFFGAPDTCPAKISPLDASLPSWTTFFGGLFWGFSCRDLAAKDSIKEMATSRYSPDFNLAVMGLVSHHFCRLGGGGRILLSFPTIKRT